MTSIDDLSSQLSDALGHLADLRTLHEVTKAVHSSLDITRTMDAVVQGVTRASGFGVAVVNLRQPDGTYEIVSVDGSDDVRREMLGTSSAEELWLELFANAEAWGSLYFVDHRTGTPEEMFCWVPDIEAPEDPEGWHPLDCLFAPLTAPSGEWVGILSVDLPRDGRRPGPVQREILELFAQHAAIAIQHAHLHHELEQSRDQLQYAATHDPLTGLANRALLRTFVDGLAHRAECPVGILVIDLDDFKVINDRAGHDSGDDVLTEVGARLRRHTRDGDVVARLGGDEFLTVLTGREVDGALRDTADRLYRVITEPIATRTGLHRVGASIGVARGSSRDDFAKLLAAADADMYRVKQAHHLTASRLCRS